MASLNEAPYRPQQRDEVKEMLRGLSGAQFNGKGKGKGGFSCRKSTFKINGSNKSVESWKMQDWDYKKPNLPTYARGLFTTVNSDGYPEIATRGYDKFFNHGEVKETEWENVEANTKGPYELSVKENGCIIFISGLEDGTLLVCSKHSTGAGSDPIKSHASNGERWIDTQLAALGRTRQDLAMRLRAMNATAVAELCDDQFEEHVLAYTPEAAGLYLHGINLNLPEFATYPHHLVAQFADQWGFKQTQFLIMDDIRQVKVFLEEVAETGNFAGRDTEGFVIRCQSKAETGIWHDWFFKYKFEEPYLMYRQWRECTKAMIAGKPPKYKKHKKITEEYLDFARRQLHANPGLRAAYQHNHGIIKMRDDFLAFRGVKGSDIIRQEALEGDGGNEDVDKDVMLVPVASIGCGKTTVALALRKLFGWGHVQNDNIMVKKGKPTVFAQECCNKLLDAPVMIADRNNHQRRERKQLIEDVTRIVPGTRLVALHYVHDRRAYDKIRRQTRERVLSRGDNHQTIQAGSKGPQEIIGIMEGFLDRFEPVNDDELPDSDFDQVIDLDVCASSRENLETVVNRLYAEYPKLFGSRQKPTAAELDDAIEEALNDYKPIIKHEIKGGGGKQKQKGQANGVQANGGKPKERKLEYFAVKLPTSRVTEVLEALFKEEGPESAQMYNALKVQRRVQSEFHVTLIHRSASSDPYWATLTDIYNKARDDQLYQEPKLGLCMVRLERLVWDGRVMAFVARLSAPDDQDWHSTNKVAHITVGTSSPAVKPVESNNLLARWLEFGSGGDTDIRELKVNGVVELEGVVRGVLQRL